jgi:hypothetical protein
MTSFGSGRSETLVGALSFYSSRREHGINSTRRDSSAFEYVEPPTGHNATRAGLQRIEEQGGDTYEPGTEPRRSSTRSVLDRDAPPAPRLQGPVGAATGLMLLIPIAKRKTDQSTSAILTIRMMTRSVRKKGHVFRLLIRTILTTISKTKRLTSLQYIVYILKFEN